jgi:hypothetical protein
MSGIPLGYHYVMVYVDTAVSVLFGLLKAHLSLCFLIPVGFDQ